MFVFHEELGRVARLAASETLEDVARRIHVERRGLVVGLAFLVMTVYLILFLAKVANKDNFYFFFIPAMVLLLIDTLLFYLRSKQLMKYLQNEDLIVKQAEEKMHLIKEKYGNKVN